MHVVYYRAYLFEKVSHVSRPPRRTREMRYLQYWYIEYDLLLQTQRHRRDRRTRDVVDGDSVESWFHLRLTP